MSFFFGRNNNRNNSRNNNTNNNRNNTNNTNNTNSTNNSNVFFNNHLQQEYQMQQPINNINNQNNINNIDGMNEGINFQPLTEDDLIKINEEIQQNIEENKKYLEQKKYSQNNNHQQQNNNFNNNLVPSSNNIITNNPNNINNINNPNLDIINSHLKEFMQNEKNSSVFYKNISNIATLNLYKIKFQDISQDCLTELNNLQEYFSNFNNNKDFNPIDIQIQDTLDFKNSIILAVEEEIKSYDKLCKIVEQFPPQDTRIFYAMALRKLGRINNIQYIFLRL